MRISRIVDKLKGRASVTYMRSRMNYWPDQWGLNEERTPCDIHLNEWIASQGLRDKTIYHFGTGTHHVVGIKQAGNGSKNRVFAITASVAEYKSYINLVTRNPEIAASYVTYFGDIYLTHPDLLPTFDLVSMFHLCEYTPAPEYGGLTDLELLKLMTAKTRANGHLLFYPRSDGWERARQVIAQWEREEPVVAAGEFKSLLVYRKSA